ncbi:hypothetical protein F383_17908 [Gossypium arboreum]|uniref:Uncharacterized protein n=1 Tax=Gossypium arboreum TaxID=29729 RepID=A0A0B0NHM0_GOSAR|nr:hypothetical protein F383_17908 [Gossypium arboreum]
MLFVSIETRLKKSDQGIQKPFWPCLTKTLSSYNILFI